MSKTRSAPLRGVDFRLMQRSSYSRLRQRQGAHNYKAFIQRSAAEKAKKES